MGKILFETEASITEGFSSAIPHSLRAFQDAGPEKWQQDDLIPPHALQQKTGVSILLRSEAPVIIFIDHAYCTGQ